jgi:hypothetical protein
VGGGEAEELNGGVRLLSSVGGDRRRREEGGGVVIARTNIIKAGVSIITDLGASLFSYDS